MRRALLALLGLSVLVDLTLGAWASVAWESYVNKWLPDLRLLAGVQADDVRLLGLVLGLSLLCFAAIQILAIRWVRDEKEEGLTLALVFGGYLIVSSVITFLVFQNRVEFLIVDGLRGALLTVFAVVLRNAPATIRVLRLPDDRRRAGRDQDRPAARRERPGRQRFSTRSPERDDRRRDRPVAVNTGERTRENGEGRPTRARRRRSGRQDEQASSPESDGGRKHLRPVVTAKPSRRGARPAAVKTTGVETQVRSGSPDSRAPETDSDHAAARVANRSRTTEELLAEDVARYRRRPSSGGENPLAVVVRGDLDAPRTPSMSASLQRTDSDRDSSEKASSDNDAPGTSRKRRRRRRRPRSQESDGVASDSGDEIDEAARRSDPTSVSDEESEDRTRDVGREGPAITEALDMLSMLEPAEDDSYDDEPVYGRSRRPNRRRSGRRH